MKRLLLGLICATIAAPSHADGNRLIDVRVEADGAGALVEVVGTRPPSFTTASRDGRLVIDFDGAAWPADRAAAAGVGPLLRVRGEERGGGARLTLELAPGAEAALATSENTLRVAVSPGIGLVPAERNARQEAERIAQLEAERQARAEAERIARVEAERLAREEAERIAGAAAERQAREEAERIARVEAERQAREEAERIARFEADRQARAEAERQARAEADRAAQLEAKRLAREEAQRIERAEEERQARAEAERVARLDTARPARADAERVARLEAERQARAEAERLAQLDTARPGREGAVLEAERREREERDRLALLATTHPPAAPVRQAAARGAERAPHTAAAPHPTTGARQELTYLGFKPTPAGARIVLRTTARPAYRLEQAPGRLVLVLERAGIPVANNRRSIDASFFGTPVGLIKPIVDSRRDEVRIEIALRTAAPRFEVAVKGHELHIDFER